MSTLKCYAPRDNKYVEAKNKLVNNVGNFYKERKKIFEGFKNGVFPVYYSNREDEEDEEDEEDKQEKQKEQEEKQEKQEE